MTLSSQKIINPYDEDAKFAAKGDVSWEGYKAHFSETCDEELPRIITRAVTTKATVPDVTMMMCIQEYLYERNLKPAEHFVDGGYISAKSFVDSEEIGIEIVGPTSEISNWQSKAEGGLTADQFQIHWEQAYVECPAGKHSISWRDSIKDGKPVINVRFGKSDCQGCLLRERCTRSKTAGRTLQLKEQKTHELMARMRIKSKESNMKQRYQIRSGIESTIA